MPGIQFTSYVPTSLVGNNSPSPTLAADNVLGLPISTGAFPGNVFFLSEQQASQLSQTVVNNAAPAFVCHAGWYMVVQVAASAVAGNIKAGAIGACVQVPSTFAAEQVFVPPQSVVTDCATASTAGLLANYPVVFLNTVTPGNYTIVQIAGDASVLLAASVTIAGQTANNLIQSAATVGCTVGAGTTRTSNDVGIVQQFFNTPAGALTLSAVAAASGGSTVYTGTITGGGTNLFVGNSFVITGFTGAAAVNNGTFLCTACTTTTLTLSNANGVAVTAAGTATAVNLIRANVAFPFGIV